MYYIHDKVWVMSMIVFGNLHLDTNLHTKAIGIDRLNKSINLTLHYIGHLFNLIKPTVDVDCKTM